MTNETMWHMGYVLGVSLVLFITLTLALLSWHSYKKWRAWQNDTEKSPYESSDWGFTSVSCAVLAFVFLVLSLFIAFPFNSEFHQYRRVHGQVTEISSKFITEGKGTTQRFVVIIDGQPYGIDDTRAALLKKGDTVDLWCSKEWQLAGKSGYACNWGNS